MRKKNKPIISIIMNCYNGEKYLIKSLTSVISQTFKNWELIFFDNNSKDKSKKIFLSFKEPRFKYFYNKNFKKLYAARNLALSKSKGEYICFLDTDDWWHKNKLKNQLSLFYKNKKLKFSYTNFFLFNERDKKIKICYKSKLPKGFITQSLLNNYCIGILTVMIKKELFRKYSFNQKYNIIGDFDLFLRLSKVYKIESIQKPLSYYRLHKNNLSQRKIDDYIEELNFWLKDFNKKNKKLKYSLKKIQLFIFKLKIKKLFSNNLKKLINIGRVVQW